MKTSLQLSLSSAIAGAVILFCASTGAQTVAPAAAVLSAPSVAVDGDYVLRSNDVISVAVFQEPDLACSERIASDGTISVPLAGRVKVSGLTPLTAAHAIRGALESNYLVKAQVTVSVTEATKQLFTLLGQVTAPGSYALPSTGHVSLMQAIGMAGGFTRSASTGRIMVKRHTGGAEQLIKVDADKIANGKTSEGFDVLPGDVITVKERIF